YYSVYFVYVFFTCSTACISLIYTFFATSYSFFPFFLFFIAAATPGIYTLSLHDALPISRRPPRPPRLAPFLRCPGLVHQWGTARSEEHTSELQSRFDLVCRLLLEKKKGCCILFR